MLRLGGKGLVGFAGVVFILDIMQSDSGSIG